MDQIKHHATEYYKGILGTAGIKYAHLGDQFWDETDKVTLS